MLFIHVFLPLVISSQRLSFFNSSFIYFVRDVYFVRYFFHSVFISSVRC